MSVSSAGKVPEINLDEFERRLRSAGAAPSGADDPLAELARLVATISQEGVVGDPLAAPQARMPKAASAFPAGDAVPVRPVDRLGSGPSQAPFGAAPAPLGAVDDVDLPAVRGAAPSAAVEEDRPRTGRPRSWYFATAGLAAIGLALLAGAATLKMGAPTASKTPPFIAAAAGPSKIQPPSDATARSGGDSAGLLMKDSATGAPVKIVATEEKPLVVAAGSPVAAAAATPIVAPAAPSVTVAPLFPDANPVKTVSVRPDGTLISVDSTPTPAPAAQGAARAVDTAPVGTTAAPAAGEPATPKLDLPTKLSPKSSARVVAKTDTTAPAAATDATPTAPLPLAAPAAAAKAAKTPPAKAAPVVADAPAAPAAAAASEPAAAGGGWAVQFAAPRSQADAQSAIARLKSKYAAALGYANLVVREAEVKGETIYRVRADGLSREDASALCAKLKASGGDCFPTKN
jgi:hypothetical protein